MGTSEGGTLMAKHKGHEKPAKARPDDDAVPDSSLTVPSTGTPKPRMKRKEYEHELRLGFRSCGRFWGMIAGVDAGRSVACSSTASKLLAARLCPFRWFELLVVV